MGRTGEGKRLKIPPVVDAEYLFELHGEPDHIRSDNGPEFIAEAVPGWPARRGSKTI